MGLVLNRRSLIRAGLAGLSAGPVSLAASVGSYEGFGYRNAHCACADDAGSILAFGGADTEKVLGDLWRLRGHNWQCLSRAGPCPRTFGAMAYDTRRRRLVLIGGNRVLFGSGGREDTLLDDHWEWDGRHWTLFAGSRPPSRAEGACVFDPVRKRLLLFGGYRFVAGERTRLNDLWCFEGARWHQLDAFGPSPRNGAAFVFDPDLRSAVVLGGSGNARDVWTFDEVWNRIAELPRPRFNAAGCYDSRAHGTVLFGGWADGKRVSETVWLGKTGWRAFDGTQPPARNHATLTATPQGPLLIGGHDGENLFGDLWRLGSGGWQLLTDLGRAPRIDNGH